MKRISIEVFALSSNRKDARSSWFGKRCYPGCRDKHIKSNFTPTDIAELKEWAEYSIEDNLTHFQVVVSESEVNIFNGMTIHGKTKFLSKWQERGIDKDSAVELATSFIELYIDAISYRKILAKQ